jgi:hypothetical protein
MFSQMAENNVPLETLVLNINNRKRELADEDDQTFTSIKQSFIKLNQTLKHITMKGFAGTQEEDINKFLNLFSTFTNLESLDLTEIYSFPENPQQFCTVLESKAFLKSLKIMWINFNFHNNEWINFHNNDDEVLNNLHCIPPSLEYFSAIWCHPTAKDAIHVMKFFNQSHLKSGRFHIDYFDLSSQQRFIRELSTNSDFDNEYRQFKIRIVEQKIDTKIHLHFDSGLPLVERGILIIDLLSLFESIYVIRTSSRTSSCVIQGGFSKKRKSTKKSRSRSKKSKKSKSKN